MYPLDPHPDYRQFLPLYPTLKSHQLLVLGVVHGGDWEGAKVLEGDNWTFYKAQQITFYQVYHYSDCNLGSH